MHNVDSMERIWLKSYPKNIPHDINIRHSSIYEQFKEYSRKFNNKTAFENYGQTISFQNWRDQAGAWASFLHHRCKLKKGDRIAVQMPNILQTPIAVMGALQAGLAVVNINPLYTARELKEILVDADVKAILIFSHSAHTLQSIQKEVRVPNIIVSDLGDLFSLPKRIIFHCITHYIKKMVRPFQFEKSFSFVQALKIGKTYPSIESSVQLEDPAFLQYTGGTTGKPKGAVLSHKNILSNIEQGRAWMLPFLEEGKEVSIAALPLYHIFALTINLFIVPSHGAHSVLITNPRDVKNFIKTLKKLKFSILVGVNSLFKLLLNDKNFKNLNFKFLKTCIAGGAGVESSVYEQWLKTAKAPITEGYGLTEASPVVCCNLLSDPKPGNCGFPFPSTHVRIMDSMQKELDVNQIGELEVKGPQVMQGYWKNPSASQKVLNSQGWLSTGDLAKVNSKGMIFIVDRKKDMILVSGFNVYPNEVENVIVSHPQVKQAAVIGVPDAHSGEAPKAFVVKSSPRLTQEELIKFCKQNLTSYKIPKHIEFRAHLPLSSIGKVLRRKLK